MNKELVVGEYIFENAEDANVAKMELEKIDKLKEKLKGADIPLLYKVYNRSIENGTFKTPIGYEFMVELRSTIMKDSSVKDNLLPIPVGIRPVARNVDSAELRKANENQEKTKNILKWSVFINIILFFVVVALFIISSTSDRPNIINYRTAVIDEYSSWEEELSDREAAVSARERELNISN